MKRGMMLLLLMAVLGMLAGCAKQGGTEKGSVPTVQIAQSAYYYEQGYVQAEGWRYDITLASPEQIAQLDALVDAMVLNLQTEEFRFGQGYRLIWRNAAQNVTKEMLVLSQEESVSMQGMMFEAEGVQPLLSWLEALQLDEQSIGD